MRWAAIEKPAIFFSIVVGSIGPVLVLTVPKIRHRLGDGPRPQIPLTYPSTLMHQFDCKSQQRLQLLMNVFRAVPSGPRKPLSGYDDE